MTKTSAQPIIFFGNGPLADYTLAVLQKKHEIIFHARTRDDLAIARELKIKTPQAFGVLASFGVMIKPDLLDVYEPTGILNIHPSLLPLYRGPSPIESAILHGDQDFGVSIMKLAKAMDAGPIYHQITLSEAEIFADDQLSANDANDYKLTIYQALAEAGANWLSDHLGKLPTPVPQDDSKATFTKMLDKSLSPLEPTEKTSSELLNEIRAFAGFPKSKYQFCDLECTIINAHISEQNPGRDTLYIQCKDKKYLVIDYLQPAGRKIMDAKSFLNGYAKK